MAKSVADFLQPKSLRQRTALFIGLPVLLTLVMMGGVSLLLIRTVLLEQWHQIALARLERSATMVDLRLQRPKRLLMLFQKEAGKEMNRQVARFLIERIKNLDGVIDVTLEWYDNAGRQGVNRMGSAHRPGMQFHRVERLGVASPVYDAQFEDRIVSLISEFRDENDRKLGQVTVKIAFYDLIEDVVASAWWKSNDAFLVDAAGNLLTETKLYKRDELEEQLIKFGGATELEIETFRRLQEEESGTVFGDGLPPKEISGFYRLREAPWTVVVIAQGESVLASILKFRQYYFLTGFVTIVLALALIRWGSAGTTAGIRRVSAAASDLAGGVFGPSLDVKTRDEVGELTANFNIMTSQLKERMQLQEAMGIAREVQQNLLPQSCYKADGITIAGASIYCQETGGDYFDLLESEDGSGRVAVVVGDVVGHGIGAALLMATVRALVRCRTSLPGDVVDIVGDVNKLLCQDTAKSGNFVTLFYLVTDMERGRMDWVRCGHDPAIVYDTHSGEFSELRGKGFVLGFESEYQFEQNSLALDGRPKIILLGSDGVWDAENEAGERFGRDRVHSIIRDHKEDEPEQLIAAVGKAIENFRGNAVQNDDITMVIIKTGQVVG